MLFSSFNSISKEMTKSFRTNSNGCDFDSNLSNAFKQFHQIICICHSGAIYLFDTEIAHHKKTKSILSKIVLILLFFCDEWMQTMFEHNNTIVTRAKKLNVEMNVVCETLELMRYSGCE